MRRLCLIFDFSGTILSFKVVKKFIIDDQFWRKLQRFVDVTLPTKNLVDFFNHEGPTMGKAYHAYFEIGEELSEKLFLTKLFHFMHLLVPRSKNIIQRDMAIWA